jgi:hypothetical protein
VKVPLRLAAPDAVGDADRLGLPVPQEVNVGEGCCVRETLADALTLMVRPQLRETLGDALEVAQRVSEPLTETPYPLRAGATVQPKRRNYVSWAEAKY